MSAGKIRDREKGGGICIMIVNLGMYIFNSVSTHSFKRRKKRQLYTAIKFDSPEHGLIACALIGLCKVRFLRGQVDHTIGHDRGNHSVKLR
ncbi:hypothetical protein AI2913V1_2644 [Klebsiella aerogenes]|nr:hypothetical protein AI2913V1_2644 [Klebsiella aerogenes]CAH5883891.1 hypothetical protein AI2913V1_2644 [Klebsiella aerogenes]